MSRVERRKQKKKRMQRIFCGSLVLGIAGLYILGAVYFKDHYYKNTNFAGVDVSFMTPEKAQEVIEDQLLESCVVIEEESGSEVIESAQVGLSYTNLEKNLGDMRSKQTYPAWLAELFGVHDYPASDLQLDQSKLEESIKGLSCMNPETVVPSENPKIIYDDKEGKYIIQAETIGNVVDEAAFTEAVKAAFLQQKKEVSLKDSTYFVKSEYNSESKAVVEAKNNLNSYLKGTISYADGELKAKLTKAEIQPMLTCSSDYQVSIDKTKVKEFVQKKVSPVFNSIKGKIPAGLTAWKVDEKKEIRAIIKNIKSGKKAERKPSYSKEGFDRDNYKVGNTYIDVSIQKQHMWFVEDGKVIFESDIVTGDVARDRDTATGFYRIAYKQRDHLMVKYNAFVHYWMPYNTSVGIGFHDASWRSKFGGTIYKTDGSHGCINMPPEKAKKLYSLVGKGDAVYVHN